MNIYRYIVFFFLCPIFATAQNVTIKGTINRTTDNSPLQNVSVRLSGSLDSTRKINTVSGSDGNFYFNHVVPGTYFITIKALGFVPFSKTFAVRNDNEGNLGVIHLSEAAIALNEVVVKNKQAPVAIKGDTIEFNAGSFKTQANDNVEQLLKKLPGVEIDASGRITAQGKAVVKILVDGKEFFGNDPKAATKNLPADAISKIQIISDKTEKTKATGIDDGQRDKVINLKLKDDKKSGWFGNTALEGGTHDRYLAQANANHFDNKRQFSVLLLSNNINESGFTIEDLNNFSGGNPFNVFSNGGNSNTFNVSSSGRININGAFSGVSGGLITTHSGGINFSDELGKKVKFNVSFVSVLSKNDITQFSNIADPITNGYLYTVQQSRGHNTANSYRTNLNLEYTIDSLTVFKFKPIFTVSHKTANALTNSSLSTNETVTSQESQNFIQGIKAPTLSGLMSLGHRLHNGKGSINASITGSYSQSKSNYTNDIRISNPTISNDSTANTTTDQRYQSNFVTSTVSYVRRINQRKKINLVLAQITNYKSEKNNQLSLEYNPVNGRYELLVPSLTGYFKSDISRVSGVAGINKNGAKFTESLNVELANIVLDGNSTNSDLSIRKQEFAVVPSATVSYQDTHGSNFFVTLKSDVTMPSIYDLQPVLNNTNPLYVRLGNSNLKPSRNLTFNSSFSNFNGKTNSFININLNFTNYWNGFSTQSLINDQLVQTIRPINIDGNYAGQLDLSLGKPTKVVGLKYSFGFGGTISRSKNAINNNENSVHRISPNVSLGLSYDHNTLSLSIRTNDSYNSVSNSFQNIANTSYYLLSVTYKGSWEPIKNWRIFSDLIQNNYLGQNNVPNDSQYLLNSGIEKFLSKSRLLSLSLGGYDLFNQSAGLQRSISSTGRIEAYQTNAIGRFAYLKLSYKINKFSAKSTNNAIRKL